jgi:hypothetical protein
MTILLVLAALLAPAAGQRPVPARVVVASVQRTAEPSRSPTSTSTPIAADGFGPRDTDDGTPLWFWIGLAVVVVLFAALWIALLTV